MKLFVYLVSIFLTVGAYKDFCPKTAEFLGKTWVVTKLNEGKITSVAVDKFGSIYYLEDNKLFVINGNKLLTPLEDQKCERYVRDLTSDSKGNIFLGSNGHIDVIESEKMNIENLMKDGTAIVKYLTVDYNDNLLVLANIDSPSDEAFYLHEKILKPLPEGKTIKRHFAVDAMKNRFDLTVDAGVNYRVNYVDMHKPVYDGVTLSVTKEGHVFYADGKGLYVVENSNYDKMHKILKLSGISRIAFDNKGRIYLASKDSEDGGIYMIEN